MLDKYLRSPYGEQERLRHEAYDSRSPRVLLSARASCVELWLGLRYAILAAATFANLNYSSMVQCP